MAKLISENVTKNNFHILLTAMVRFCKNQPGVKYPVAGVRVKKV